MGRRRGLIGAGVGAAAAAALIVPALAQEREGGGVLLSFGLDQRLEADDNLDLDPVSEGTTVTATTRLSFGLLAETAVDRLSLEAATALRAVDGPEGGESFLDDTRLGLGYTREGASARLSLDAGYRSARVEYLRPLEDFLDEGGVIVLPEDLDDLEGEGTRATTSFGAKLELGLDAPLGLTLDARASALDYSDVTDPDLTDTRRLRLGATARLALSPVMAGTLSLSHVTFEDDDAADTRRETLAAEIGLDYDVSPVLTASAGLGFSTLDIREFGATETVEGATLRLSLGLDRPNGDYSFDLASRVTEDGIRQDITLGRSLELPQGTLEASLGVTGIDWEEFEAIGALSWRQELTPGSQVSAQLRRAVVVNADDEDELVTALAVGYSRELTPVAGIDLDLTFSVAEEGGGSTDRASFTATYRHALTEDWTLDAGYRHRLEDEPGPGTASSNSVFLGLGRRFETRP